VLNLGGWGVATPLEPIAHMIIYVGATPSMFAALLLLIWSWGKLIREGTANIKKPNLLNKLGALVRDPLKFGPTWQMLFMNFTTSGIGIFMAIRLEEIFRVWPAREERIELTGHWHALSAIIATIILLYYGDMLGLKGKVRQFYGWGLLIFSDIALGAVTVFEMKRLFIEEAVQQPLVNGLMLAMDFGLGMLLVLLAVVMIWRLTDLFKPKGRWTEEVNHELSQEVTK
jgi:heme A synthase